MNCSTFFSMENQMGNLGGIVCKRKDCANVGKHAQCTYDDTGIHAQCVHFSLKEYTFDDMNQMNLVQLEELKHKKLAQFASVQGEKEKLMANIMCIQNMIKKEQTNDEKNSTD